MRVCVCFSWRITEDGDGEKAAGWSEFSQRTSGYIFTSYVNFWALTPPSDSRVPSSFIPSPPPANKLTHPHIYPTSLSGLKGLSTYFFFYFIDCLWLSKILVFLIFSYNIYIYIYTCVCSLNALSLSAVRLCPPYPLIHYPQFTAARKKLEN
jgi:hypothetical protein